MPTSITSPSLLETLITAAALAQRLDTTERNLSEWRITGRGPKYMRVGRRAMYAPDAVDDWLRTQEFRSTSEELR